MQMRSCAIWLSVVGLIATASPSLAFAKGKKAKKDSADTAAEAPAKEEPKSGGSVDDLMNDSVKKKTTSSSSSSDADAVAPSKPEPSGEPDAWERPPVEEEKPKKKAAPVVAEEKKGDGRNIEVALTAGWATQTTKFFSADPYGFGFGLRGAYELESHLVLGVGAEYFIGNSSLGADKVGTSTSGLVSTSANYFLANAEVGYNWWLANDVILRPSMWVGLSFGTQNPPMLSGTSGVMTAFSLSPGLTLQYIMGRTGWFIGADARINLILGEGNSGVLFHGMLGKRF